MESIHILSPGLTPGSKVIPRLTGDLTKYLAILNSTKDFPFLWVVFLGGTGTGKSTLFNALVGCEVSETGVERPKTVGAVGVSHQSAVLDRHFPFSDIQLIREPWDGRDRKAIPGFPGHFLILEHAREDMAHMVVVDTPDLDSLEEENRQMAQDLYLLSDAVVFVTSQEKYADDVPFQFFLRIFQEKKPVFLLLNKCRDGFSENAIRDAFAQKDIQVDEKRLWFVPYAASDRFQMVSEDAVFKDFKSAFFKDLSSNRVAVLRKIQTDRLKSHITNSAARIRDILKEEEGEGKKWLKECDRLFDKTVEDLLRLQKERFASETRAHLNKEMRKLFERYDLLAKPRKIVQEIFKTPFRLLGLLREKASASRRHDLLKVKERMDFTAVETAMEKFNNLVLESLSSLDPQSAMFRGIRQAGVVLTDKEIGTHILNSQQHMAEWLEERFQKLSKGIPRSKEWGIYSTSILWGMMILAFEAIIGGGFTIVDAALDSALAPLITKGAMELFAYNEVQNVAGELAARYRESLVSVLRIQRDRYRTCLGSLLTSPDVLDDWVRENT